MDRTIAFHTHKIPFFFRCNLKSSRQLYTLGKYYLNSKTVILSLFSYEKQRNTPKPSFFFYGLDKITGNKISLSHHKYKKV